MPQKIPSFEGTITDNYEKFFSPMLFTVTGKDLVSRLPGNVKKILELACGTGQVTRFLIERFPGVQITATDLYSDMITTAKSSFERSSEIKWKVMDAQEITYDDNLFDAVICQFGVMFFPDKQKAFNEVHRVLKQEGMFIFSTWDNIKEQHIAEITRDTINSFFPDDPVNFFDIPYSMYDEAELKRLMENSGFKNVTVENVHLEGHTDSAENAAKGFVLGNPMYNAICERDKNLLPEILKEAQKKFTQEFGAGQFNVPLSEFVTSGIK